MRSGTKLANIVQKPIPLVRWSGAMKRRDFLKSVSGIATAAMVSEPAIWSSAKAAGNLYKGAVGGDSPSAVVGALIQMGEQ